MKIEVVITYWGKFEIPKVVLDSWENQTDKDFKMNFLKLEYPIYRNLALLDAVTKSDADIIFITDGDCVYKTNAIEELKKTITREDSLYFFNRLMLNEKTTKRVEDFLLRPEDIIPLNDINDNDKKYRGVEDNNFPNNPGAFGHCQIGYRSLLKTIIPKEPILGWAIYDSIIQDSAPNIMIKDSYCYHLNHRRDGVSKNDVPAKVRLQHMNRYDFGELLNNLNLTGSGLELGVQKGEFSEAIAKTWHGGHLFLVDIWEHQNEGYVDLANVSTEEHIKNMVESIERVGQYLDSNKVSVLRMRSNVAVLIFPNNFLDWVYLDANHSFLETKMDIARWFHKVRSGGMIAGDDWDWPSVNRAVYETIMALGNNTPVTITTIGNRSWYFIKP